MMNFVFIVVGNSERYGNNSWDRHNQNIVEFNIKICLD